MKTPLLHSSIPSRRIKIRRLSFFFIISLMTSTATPALGLSALTESTTDSELYLRTKYAIEIFTAESRWDSVTGTYKALYIKGSLVPPVSAALGVVATHNPYLVAKAFFAAESVFLGIIPGSEMRQEVRPNANILDTDELGYSHLRYHQYIAGLQLLGTETTLHIAPDGQITVLNAEVLPITPELLYAITLPTLSKAQISQIAKDDMRAAAKAPDTEPWAKHYLNSPTPIPLSFTKAAISVAPYVVWKVEGVWSYTFDAFTGKVLKKLPNWRD